MKGFADLGGIMTIAASVAIGFVVFVVVLTIGGSVLTSFNTGITNGTDAANILHNGSAGLLQIATQSNNIGLVIGMTIILMVLVAGLGFFLFRQQ